MKEQIFEELSRIGPRMESLRAKANPSVNYHALADAIYWSDEIPSELSDFGENCMRLVFRYRTTLILEKPDLKWKPYWDEALKQFPDWIGFREDRIIPSAKLKSAYDQLKAEAKSRGGA